jgi:hypothetical protein
VPNSFVVIVPSPSLSNKLKASLNSNNGKHNTPGQQKAFIKTYTYNKIVFCYNVYKMFQLPAICSSVS